MSVQARVARLYADHTVQLELLEPPTRCSGCEGKCLWRWAPTAPLRLHTTVALQPEDRVTVTVDRRGVLLAALLLHGLPWLGLLTGALLGVWSLGGDLGTFLGALAGLAVGSMLARRRQAHWRIEPVLTRAGRP